MNKIEVLSINPGTNNIGILNNTEIKRAVAQSSRIIGNRSDTLTADTVDFLTAVRHPSAMRLGTALLMLRIAFGVLMIITGCFSIPALSAIDSFAALQPYWFGMVQIVAGAFFCLGFATRLTSLAGIIAFGTIAAISLISSPEIGTALSSTSAFATPALSSTSAALDTPFSLVALTETVSTLTQTNFLLSHTALLYTFGCFVFFVLGAGRISVDGLIRKHAVIMRNRRKDPSRLAGKRLSYQAFRYTSAH